MHDFLAVLRAWRDVKGRTTRRAFWTYLFVVVLVGVGVSVLGSVLGAMFAPAHRLGDVYVALALVPTVTAAVRRLHDGGYSRLLVLVGLVPFVGRIGLALLLARERTDPHPSASE